MKDGDRKLPVGSIQKFSTEDGPGIRTTVFLKGCPLNCRWCHNPEMIDSCQQLVRIAGNCIGCGACIKVCETGALKAEPQEGIVIDRKRCTVCLRCADVCYAKALRAAAKPMTVEDIIEEVEKDKGFYDNTGGGLTVSGGELLMHGELTEALIEAAAARDISVCLDTCGYGDTQLLRRLASMENVSHILYDMKTVNDETHLLYTGVSNRLIIDNLVMLAEDSRTAEKLIMRMPLIGGVNDDEDTIRRTGQLYSRLGIRRADLLPYHSFGRSKMKNIGGLQEEFSAPTEERIREIRDYFEREINLTVEIRD